MGLLVHTPEGWIDSRANEVALFLKSGKPEIGWRGDPFLELRIGRVTDQYGRVRTDPRSGLPTERYEVWRNCADVHVKPHPKWGQYRRIGKWEMNEIDKILRDMVQMDPRTRGHMRAEEAVDKMIAQEERDRDHAIEEKLGPLMEHMLALARDADGLAFHGQAGFGEGKMTRQRKRAEERAGRKLVRTD